MNYPSKHATNIGNKVRHFTNQWVAVIPIKYIAERDVALTRQSYTFIHNAGSCGDTLVHNDWNDENEYDEDEHDDDENNCDECIADESSEVIHHNM